MPLITSPVDPQRSAQSWEPAELSVLTLPPPIFLLLLPHLSPAGGQVWAVPLQAFAGFPAQKWLEAHLGIVTLTGFSC